MEKRFETPQRYYCPQNFIDHENVNHGKSVAWYSRKRKLFEKIRKMGGYSGSNTAKTQRDVLCEYLVTDVGYKQTSLAIQICF